MTQSEIGQILGTGISIKLRAEILRGDAWLTIRMEREAV
jgi:hypothetical protein